MLLPLDRLFESLAKRDGRFVAEPGSNGGDIGPAVANITVSSVGIRDFGGRIGHVDDRLGQFLNGDNFSIESGRPTVSARGLWLPKYLA